MPVINVDLGVRSYPIHIQAGLLQDAGLLASNIERTDVFIISNDTVAPMYLDALVQILVQNGKRVNTIVLPDGEAHKTLASFDIIMDQLLSHNAARDAILVALGGGVIGDMTGFAAACYQRGVDFVQIPTTLLAQVDSSVGGKTAVNHPRGKNMIGAFHQPTSVIIDTETLSSLPAKEFSAGMAEVIKYGIIYDKHFFLWLQNNISAIKALQNQALTHMISRCCEIKAEVVRADEKEHGIRALLNLGHTFGHAIETEKGYGTWLHGEAVAAGMVLAAELAVKRNWLSREALAQIRDLIAAFDLPTEGPSDMSANDYIKHMQHDKKVLNGVMRFILPTAIGKAAVIDDVSQQELIDLLD